MCSDEFAPLARAESQVAGRPGLPLVAVPHPVAGNPAEVVARKAEAIADEVLSVLTEPAATLSARYQGRFTKPADVRLSPESVCTDAVCSVDAGEPR